MFTGLIEALGDGRRAVEHRRRAAAGSSCARRSRAELRPGDSLAVNGVCLTVTGREDDRAAFDIGPETARVTTLGALGAGRRVNLERAMRADARLGGHFVQGHVDGIGTVVELRPEAEFTWWRSAFPGSWRGLSFRRARWPSTASA